MTVKRRGLSSSTAGAGCVGVLVALGPVAGEVAFRRLQLLDPACNKLAQSHERV